MIRNKLVKLIVKNVLFFITDITIGIIVLFLTIFFIPIFRSKTYKKFLFCEPILNDKYWATALKESGYIAETWVVGFFNKINTSSDFDKVISPRNRFANYLLFFYSLIKFDVFVFSFNGGFLGTTLWSSIEGPILKLFSKKVIVIPFGADFYEYSYIIDVARRHSLMSVYPQFGTDTFGAKRRTDYWVRYSDAIVPGHLIEGLSRWDVTHCNPIITNVDATDNISKNYVSSGQKGEIPVKILHVTNHDLIKGTEYIEHIITLLKNEGLNIEFELLRGVQNKIVQQKMSESDILIDQINSGYALSAIEGMANRCVVLSNITRPYYYDFLLQYSFMDECPIVSVNFKDLFSQLKILIKNPDLRKNLSLAAKEYAMKYHSYSSGVEMFEAIIDYFEDRLTRTQLINYYHPLIGVNAKNNVNKIKHPLTDKKKVIDPSF